MLVIMKPQKTKGNNVMTPPPSKSNSHYRNFALVLYPDCDEHMYLLRYISEHPYQTAAVWICHQAEPSEDDGEEKKQHYHVLYKVLKSSSPSAQEKYFGGFVKHIEAVSNEYSYAQYMIHDTLASINKIHYSVDDVFTNDEKLKSKLFGKNYVLRNLATLINMGKESCGDLFDFLQNVIESPNAEDLLTTYQKYAFTITSGMKQYNEKILRMYAKNEFAREMSRIETETIRFGGGNK